MKHHIEQYMQTLHQRVQEVLDTGDIDSAREVLDEAISLSLGEEFITLLEQSSLEVLEISLGVLGRYIISNGIDDELAKSMLAAALRRTIPPDSPARISILVLASVIPTHLPLSFLKVSLGGPPLTVELSQDFQCSYLNYPP